LSDFNFSLGYRATTARRAGLDAQDVATRINCEHANFTGSKLRRQNPVDVKTMIASHSK